MSAVRIIFKRSSIYGKRPTGANLEAGEIGLNTNATDPGLFFEVNNGSVVKVGPTSYLPEWPTQTPSLGELWVDKDTKTLSIGTEFQSWQTVATPFLGGTSGFTVFVAPEYENASDSLANDGQAIPFITLNRAVLEVTKTILKDYIAGLSTSNNRYLIVLAPGQHCVINTPGAAVSNFTVDLSNPETEVTQDILSKFNPQTVGGLVLPRGVSVIGLDLKKCEVHPVYVPTYTHPEFPADYTLVPNGPSYKNQPLSSIFRWSGNTYLSNFTGLDKVESRLVTQVFSQSTTNWAIFKTNRPHGLSYNDFVQITYSAVADQAKASFSTGQYFVNPLNAFEFQVSTTIWGTENQNPILASSLPPSYFAINSSTSSKFQVSNIYPYFAPLSGESYELHNYSHHRLSLIKNASIEQINEYYVKVQKAFPLIFGSQVSQNLVSVPEYEIVAPTSGNFPDNLSTNSTTNTSPYLNQVNQRSNFGMASGDFDGNAVSGFKSVIVNSSTSVTLQKDPVAYELYTANQDWIQLTAYTKQTLGGTRPIESIPTLSQLENLNIAAIPNIRYYYTNLTVTNPSTNELQSVGIPDPDNDFRHFGFRVSGSNSYMQAQSVYTIGAAIGCWAKSGGLISLTNSTSNFGSVAFQSEGFAGIGTLGGANDNNKGFLLSGIVRPLRLIEEQVNSERNKRILYLGSKIVHVGIDPNNRSVQLVYLQRAFDPATILPFSLKPGSAIFSSDSVCSYRAFLVNDGSATCILSGTNVENPYSPGGAVLRCNFSDSTIPNGPSDALDIPYIRRFIDPRTDSEKSYGFFVQSTNPTSQAPQLGSVLRLNQTGQDLSQTIKRNYQFDPGIYGGISQVFTVNAIETTPFTASPNFNYKIADNSQSTSYTIFTSLTDASTPWVQSVPSKNGFTPFYNPSGSYITYQNKNYYAAENNLWTSLYYKTAYNPLNGPTKVSPDKSDSPFVITSVLEKNELVSNSWQGYVPDPYLTYYTTGVPDPYEGDLAYMRGAVVPYPELPLSLQIDEDDGTDNFGIIFNRLAVDETATVTVAVSTTVQTGIPMTSPFVTSPSFGRPGVIRMELLSTKQIVSPRETLSILQLSNPALNAVEYVRVISLNSNVIDVIRNYYPSYAQGTLPATWPIGTIVKACVSTGYPEPFVYDSNWGVTKATVFRFFELMGYSNSLISPYLEPKYFGERLLQIADLPYSPINGYATLTTPWPIEFNNPSSIIANTHTWTYTGYLDYSRGLPKYQVNQIPNKLSYDYQSMVTWSGRLTVSGVNEQGQRVSLGPSTQALTAQYNEFITPISFAADRQLYKNPERVAIPKPILVYSVDDISGDFDGSTTTFDLTRAGYPVPASQLSTYGVFVFLGGVVQKPLTAYTIQQSSTGPFIPQIVFSEAPSLGTSCDVRIVTSDDEDETMEVMNFGLSPVFDDVVSSFNITPSQKTLTNLNSFLMLGGVEQNPFGVNQTSAAYTISHGTNSSTLTLIGGAPLVGTVLDFRGIMSGERYRNSGVSTVFVTSVDDISPLFDSTRTTFPLEIDGEPVDPTKVNAQNMFVNLGGVIQIPINQAGSVSAGNSYTVSINSVTSIPEITFAVPPLTNTTSNIRIITSDEFLTCPLPDSLTSTLLEDGPGIVVNENNQIIGIDSGLVL